jgi:hypothetical protein
MLDAIFRHGAIVPIGPVPSDWKEGDLLKIAPARERDVDIDEWAEKMDRLCADSSAEDDEAMLQIIEEQRRQSRM